MSKYISQQLSLFNKLITDQIRIPKKNRSTNLKLLDKFYPKLIKFLGLHSTLSLGIDQFVHVWLAKWIQRTMCCQIGQLLNRRPARCQVMQAATSLNLTQIILNFSSTRSHFSYRYLNLSLFRLFTAYTLNSNLQSSYFSFYSIKTELVIHFSQNSFFSFKVILY